jgi:hypothetical protein
MPLRFATNSIARFSSIVSMDWESVRGKPSFSVGEHNIAVGDNDNGFSGVAPGAIGTVLTSAGPGANPVFASLPWYPISLFATPALAAAAVAATGGTLLIDQSTSLGSGSKGLDFDAVTKPVRIMSIDGVNGGGSQAVMLTYSGTGTMISAIGNYGLEIEHVYLYPSGAGAKIVNAKDSFGISIHDCMLAHSTSSASNIGIDLDTAQKPVIRRNGIAANGGVGIRGVAPAGSFSINATIEDNTFFASNDVCIEAPGQAWRVVGNVAHNPVTNFIKKGPATTCDILYVAGNDIDDGTGAKTWITSNAGALISEGNRYTNSGTCISQDNSTGSVISIGDRLQASVAGIAIGTGNYLTIITPDQQHLPSGNLYSGVPASGTANFVQSGVSEFLSTINLGSVASSSPGTLNVVGTGGANYAVVKATTGATGAVNVTLPAASGTLLYGGGPLGTPASGTLTNCTGLPVSTGVSGLGSGVAALLASFSSANLRSALTDETGSGSAVFATSPTITTPNIVGTATNNNAAAGSVGEYAETVVLIGSEVSITSATAKTIASISLTAGDWDVSGIVYHHPAATTSYTRYAGSISTTDNTFQTAPGQFADFTIAAHVSNGNTYNAIIPPYRVSLSGTTTMYLVAYGVFTVSTSAGYGIIRARRVR